MSLPSPFFKNKFGYACFILFHVKHFHRYIIIYRKNPRKLNAIRGWGREGTGKQLRGRQASALALPPFSFLLFEFNFESERKSMWRCFCLHLITGDFRCNNKQNTNLSRRTRRFEITLGVTGVIRAASKRAPGVSRRHIYSFCWPWRKILQACKKRKRAKNKGLRLGLVGFERSDQGALEVRKKT